MRRKLKVAIVDDMSQRESIAATNGITCNAVREISELSPNVLLLDIAMPDKDGIKLMLHVYEDNNATEAEDYEYKTENRVDRHAKITNFLMCCGLSPKHKGFYFIKESVSLVMDMDGELPSVTKIVYPHIATIYDTESDRVERSIRTAIRRAFEKEQSAQFYYDRIEPYAMADRDVRAKGPSNRQFIFTTAEYIKNTSTPNYEIRRY